MCEHIVCTSLLHEEDARGTEIYGHRVFQYNEDKAWPPENWRELCCWYCTLELTEPGPVPIPVSACASTYKVHGLYCSFSCAKKQILETSSWNSSDSLLLLEEMARERFGVVRNIVPSPPKYTLTKFGGHLSPEAYRSDTCGMCLYNVIVPPLISVPMAFERKPPSHDESAEHRPATWTVKGLRPAATQPPTAKCIEHRQTSDPFTFRPPTEIAPGYSLFNDFMQMKQKSGGDTACKEAPEAEPKQALSQPFQQSSGTLVTFMKKQRTVI